MPQLDVAGDDQEPKDQRRRTAADLQNDEEVSPIYPVGDHATQRAKSDHPDPAHPRDRTNPEGAVREFQGEPTLGEHLDPDTEREKDVVRPEPTKVPDGEGNEEALDREAHGSKSNRIHVARIGRRRVSMSNRMRRGHRSPETAGTPGSGWRAIY